MPSPFPGMNPYLEQPAAWHDFHQAYIANIRASLTPQVRQNYIAKIDDNVYLHELSADQRLLLGRPDVFVVKRDSDVHATTSILTAEKPRAFGRLLPNVDRLTESFIEIRDAKHRELVTVIELLSPTNKRNGADRDQYLTKRGILISSNVNFVEIDLLRGDPRMPVEGLKDCDYCIMVCRSSRRPEVELWPMGLREPLPSIPIPLKPEHPDAVLHLQPLLHEIYDEASYGDYIYSDAPSPPLTTVDQEWAACVLAESKNPRPL